ncbi:MAG: phosphodiester glycosidase family protein [Bacteroidales bacterium]|nr:phosphodiester glycosidase family protein [Bacteroidales bacterium]MBQ7459126.1 phosphodiester glycosidase family protein [Bacteroidales bacterium]MBQ9530300.1 phosphodiester glycosidase family protein [Bacteroidales bacterium]
MKRLFLIAAMCVAAACNQSANADYPEWRWSDKETPADEFVEPNPDIAGKGWTNITADYAAMPDGLSIYRSPEQLQGVNAIAYIAVADLSRVTWDVRSIDDPNLQGTKDELRTPSQFYAESPAPVMVNGGFFYTDGGKRYNASVAVSGGRTYGVNINYASQDWVTIYYPTRGVFYQADGSLATGWTYYVNESAHYLYDTPAANSWDADPLPVPGATFPSEAAAFVAETAIGGGPVLLKGGEIYNTYPEELFDGPNGILCDSRHPRTAIAATDDGRLVLFVCEGRNMTEGVPGFTSAEEAAILKDLGCTEALNLDGGGSSCMIINNRETIKPSDGSQRSVASVVLLKSR